MSKCVDCGVDVVVDVPNEAAPIMKDGRWFHVREGQLYEAIIVCVECARVRMADKTYSILVRRTEDK